MRRIYASENSTARRLRLIAFAGAALGTVVVVVIGTMSRDLELRAPASAPKAVANQPTGGGPQVVIPGDPRIQWLELKPVVASPLLADGVDVWFAGAEGDPVRATLYRYRPSTGETTAIAEFTPRGPLAAVAKLGEAFVVAHGDSLTMVAPGGGTQTTTLPPRTPARVSGDAPQDIRGVAVIGRTVYATRFNVQGIEAVDMTSAVVQAELVPLPGDLAPPVGLWVLPSGELLVASPFDFHDLVGGALRLRPGSGVVERMVGSRPYSLAVLDGLVVAAQTSHTQLFALDAEGRVSRAERPIPLTGKEDRIAASGPVLVVAPEGVGVLFVSARNGAGEAIQLPVFEGEASQPRNLDAPPGQRPAPIRFDTKIESIAITSDGFVVFVAPTVRLRMGIVSLTRSDASLAP